MTIGENLTNFYGKTVKDFEKTGDITDFTNTAPRLRTSWDDKFTIETLLSDLLEQPSATTIEALVIGSWHGEDSSISNQSLIEMLVTRKQDLPNLKALFIGDITYEENEISWIQQSDLSSIWSAFPNLEECGIRGGNGLRIGKINHKNLKKLVIQAGGLPATVVREVLETNAPIEHLELWLGTENYGASTSIRDFKDLLDGKLFPHLKYLGLCNCDYQDGLAEALANSEIITRIETLDISKGTLTDKGAQTLLESGKLHHLKTLDISHHYVSEAVVNELKGKVHQLIAKDPQSPDEYNGEIYYNVAVSE